MEAAAYSKDADINQTLEKYSDLVYKLALSRTKNPSDAEDIFQEVFLKYMTARVLFENEEHKKAWLIRVTVNCTKKLFSSAWFRHHASLTDDTLHLSSEFEIRDEEGVLGAVQKLPESYRIVVHLFYYEDMSIKDISAALNKKEGTVKSLLNRARGQLREMLGEEEISDVSEKI